MFSNGQCLFLPRAELQQMMKRVRFPFLYTWQLLWWQTVKLDIYLVLTVLISCMIHCSLYYD
ncbi:hypothetical protein [Bacillus manliponensis]|uniref:hypothetical protein n=1 Tax=Bacillus manliponensis TaxID=574376 RepID=UPI0035126560